MDAERDLKEARDKFFDVLSTMHYVGVREGTREKVCDALEAYFLEWAAAHHLIIKRDPMD